MREAVNKRSNRFLDALFLFIVVDCTRDPVKRAMSAVCLAVMAIVIFAVGEISWRNVLIVVGTATLFWLLLTIVDKSLSLLTRRGKAH
jgi:energy-coupling factor transporter transmembrane protein EcfT